MIDISLLSATTQSTMVLLLVIVVKAIVSQFSATDGMRYFRFYCQRLADKVNKPNNSTQQQKISGLVALLITLLPIVVILWLFEAFVAINELWQALLLYAALGNFSVLQAGPHISQALATNNKQQAKALLSEHCLRDTSALSNMGLCKATIEMQLLKHVQLHILPIILFLSIGPITALAYRLLLEMHYSWNTKSTQFSHFGQSATQLLNILMWLPIRLYCVMYLLVTLNKLPLLLHSTRQHFFQFNTQILLALHAATLNRQLGGVAMYQQQKLRRMTANNTASQPNIADITNSGKQLFVVDILFVILVIIVATLIYAIPLLK